LIILVDYPARCCGNCRLVDCVYDDVDNKMLMCLADIQYSCMY
jgi:hypothetical protein